MYSCSASVTVAFFVRWPPTRCASSSSRLSIARFVAMVLSLYRSVCSAGAVTVAPDGPALGGRKLFAFVRLLVPRGHDETKRVSYGKRAVAPRKLLRGR